jgi:hypothetical protein
MTALEKMRKAAKCSDHGTISLMVHSAKIVGGELEEGLKGKLRMYL